jgi:hypothetical protein
MATPFLNGYSVKPASVDGLGIVTFTDGTIAVTPNQQQCEAYGYTYDRASGTCKAFTYSTSLGKSLNNKATMFVVLITQQKQELITLILWVKVIL